MKECNNLLLLKEISNVFERIMNEPEWLKTMRERSLAAARFVRERDLEHSKLCDNK